MVTTAQIRKFTPKASAKLVEAIVQNWQVAIDAGINTPAIIQEFFAQMATETGGLAKVEENLKYTTARRICQVWSQRFPNTAAAAPFVNQPQKLANKVYNGRMGNRSGSNDGWNYRGGGMLQTTGREGYEAMGKLLGLDLVAKPDLLRDPATAFISAVKEWKRRGCNALAKAGKTREIRFAINGGYNGMDECLSYLKKAKVAFPTLAVEPAKADTLASWRDPINATDIDGGIIADAVVVASPEAIDPPAPQAPDKAVIEYVQGRLKELGYTEVGRVDGRIGKFFRAATAAFRQDNALAPSTDIDTALLLALATAKPRELSAERAGASITTVKESVPEARSNGMAKILAAGTGVVSLGTAAIDGITSNIDAATSKLNPLMLLFGSVPTWVWPVGIAALAAAIWWQTHKTEKRSVEAYQTGARR